MNRPIITPGLRIKTVVVLTAAFWVFFTPTAFPQTTLQVIRDVPYFSDPGTDARFHSLDLYLPHGESGLPLVFYVHGGAFRGGDKSREEGVNFVNLFTFGRNHRQGQLIDHGLWAGNDCQTKNINKEY